MGIMVWYTSQIPKGYKLYGVFIANPFGTIAEKIVSESFEKIAKQIGSENIVAKVLSWEGATEAEEKFSIKTTDTRPILIITDVHPAKWTPKQPMIKIQLDKIKTEDDIKNFWIGSHDGSLQRILPVFDGN